MIGLDTNILLRYFLADDRGQHTRAVNFIAARCSKDDPGFVNRVSLCELVWVLTRGFAYERAEVVRTVEALLVSTDIVLEDHDAVRRALNAFKSNSVGFIDLLIRAINEAHGCDATATFDRRAAKLDGFMAVP